MRNPWGKAVAFQIMDDILQIFHRSSQAIDARDHKGVTWSEEFQKDCQFGAAVTARAAFLLGPDDGASGSAQGGVLD